MTTGIYIGCDDNRSMGTNVYPLRTAFPIWRRLHRSFPSQKQRFSYDPTLQRYYVDEKTGIPSDPDAVATISLLA